MSKLIKIEYGIMTSEELAEQQAQAEQAEREYWQSVSYDDAVHDLVRKRYSQQAVEAILNNFLAFPDVEEYVSEFKELQKYRLECKAYVKQKKEEYANG